MEHRNQGGRLRFIAMGWLAVFCFFSLLFFTIFDVKNGALLGYLVIVAVILAAFEAYSSSQESSLAEEATRLRAEEKRALLATGEGWTRGDVLEKFRTTVFYRKYGQIKTTSGWRCGVCGKNLYRRLDASIDHIKPQSKYPELRVTEVNLQVLCRPCNSTKSAYDGEDWKAITRKRRRDIKKKSRFDMKFEVSTDKNQ